MIDRSNETVRFYIESIEKERQRERECVCVCNDRMEKEENGCEDRRERGLEPPASSSVSLVFWLMYYLNVRPQPRSGASRYTVFKWTVVQIAVSLRHLGSKTTIIGHG